MLSVKSVNYSGNVSVYANGKLSWAGNDPSIVAVGKQWNETFNTITAGCAYDIDYIGNDILKAIVWF